MELVEGVEWNQTHISTECYRQGPQKIQSLINIMEVSPLMSVKVWQMGIARKEEGGGREEGGRMGQEGVNGGN